MIHPTAIINKEAEIENGVDIGPYSIIEENVRIRKGTNLIGHVVVQGRTEIGENCTISPFASIGGPPQDTTYKDDDTELVIGDNFIRGIQYRSC